MVLNIHGGPWHRDVWGYKPEAQGIGCDSGPSGTAVRPSPWRGRRRGPEADAPRRSRSEARRSSAPGRSRRSARRRARRSRAPAGRWRRVRGDDVVVARNTQTNSARGSRLNHGICLWLLDGAAVGCAHHSRQLCVQAYVVASLLTNPTRTWRDGFS